MVVLSGKPEPDAHVAGKFPHKNASEDTACNDRGALIAG